MWQIINNCLVNLMLLTSLFIFGKIVLAEKAKISKKKLLLTIFVFIIIYTIILFKCTGTTKTLIMTVLNIGFFKKMFEITNKKAVLQNNKTTTIKMAMHTQSHYDHIDR